jgi:hypothetical protein
MPRCASAATGAASTGSERPANAACVVGHNTCCHRPASVTVQPPASGRQRQQWFVLRPWVSGVTLAGVLLRATPRPLVPIPAADCARAYGLARDPAVGARRAEIPAVVLTAAETLLIRWSAEPVSSRVLARCKEATCR